jgi:hypothetical protein
VLGGLQTATGFGINSKSPFAPFAVDNNINLRGVGNIIDRGTGTVVLKEYRHTLFEKINWLSKAIYL